MFILRYQGATLKGFHNNHLFKIQSGTNLNGRYTFLLDYNIQRQENMDSMHNDRVYSRNHPRLSRVDTGHKYGIIHLGILGTKLQGNILD